MKAAITAAQAVCGFIATPGQGGDWNDCHQNQGIEAVKKGIEAAKPLEPEQKDGSAMVIDDWPEPLPLIPDERPDAYPVDALPEIIKDAANEVTAFVQWPRP